MEIFADEPSVNPDPGTEAQRVLSARRVIPSRHHHRQHLSGGALVMRSLPNLPDGFREARAQNLTERLRKFRLRSALPTLSKGQTGGDPGNPRQDGRRRAGSGLRRRKRGKRCAGSAREVFRRFGGPTTTKRSGGIPRGNGRGHHRPGSASCFSADGYVVTNNHVVDKADNVRSPPMTARPTTPRSSAPIRAPILR